MAFCNSCGATLAPGTRFCNKCGAAAVASSPGSATASSATAGPPGTVRVPVAPAPKDNTLKIVAIIAGAVVVAGVLGLAAIGLVGWRIARHSHVRQEGNNVKVETPFGVVETTKDPEAAARNIGVDIYPGAQVLQDGAATATFGGVRTASATFETTASLDQVAGFYKSKFPNAMVTTSASNRCTIVSNDPKNLITINIEGGHGDKTKIRIANVSHKSDSSSSSSQ